LFLIEDLEKKGVKKLNIVRPNAEIEENTANLNFYGLFYSNEFKNHTTKIIKAIK
jgi:hypothetical protein